MLKWPCDGQIDLQFTNVSISSLDTDMGWRPRTLPIYNDNSYTSMAREIYYKQVFGRTEPWKDANDPILLGELLPGPAWCRNVSKVVCVGDQM